MGVTGLTKYIKEKIPQAITVTTLEAFRGQRVAFDVSIWGYKFSQSAHRAAVTTGGVAVDGVGGSQLTPPTINEGKRLRLWLERFFMMTKECATSAVTPIMIFDGPAPIEKTQTKLARSQSREPARANLAELQAQWDNTAVLDRTTQQLSQLRAAMLEAVEVPPGGFDRLRQLFEQLGIPCLRSTCEADCLCASLAIEGIVAAVASTDSDSLLHGVENSITGWGPGYVEFEVRPGETELRLQIEVVSRSMVMAVMEVNQSQLVDIGLIAGTDYNLGLKGLGVDKGHKKIKSGFILPDQVNDIELRRLHQLFEYLPHEQLISAGQIRYDWDPAQFQANFSLLSQIVFAPEKFSWMIAEVASMAGPKVVYSKPLGLKPNFVMLGEITVEAEQAVSE